MDGDGLPNGRTTLVEAQDLWLTVPTRAGAVNPRRPNDARQGALTILHDVSLRVTEGEALGDRKSVV